MTAVDYYDQALRDCLMGTVGCDPIQIFNQAKQMEEEQKYETSAFWFGRGILAGKENRIEELKPNK